MQQPSKQIAYSAKAHSKVNIFFRTPQKVPFPFSYYQ